MKDKMVKRLQVGLVVVFLIVFVGLALFLKGNSTEPPVATDEQGVAETISTEESVLQNTEKQSVQSEEQVAPIDWESSIMVGQWGTNESTELLMSSWITYGEVEDFLSYVDEETGHAYVIAGVRDGKGIGGSLWRVNKPDIDVVDVSLVKQYISVESDTANYLIFNNCKYLVLNYTEEGATSGQILAYPLSEKMELLEGIPGKKTILENSQIQCEGDKLYVFDCYSDGTVCAADGVSYTEEEYVWENPKELKTEDASIYGMEVDLSDSQQSILEGLMLDCSENWDARPAYTAGYTGGDSTVFLEELHKRIYVVRKTEHFTLYGTGMDREMLLETPDGAFVSMPGYFVSNYGVQPEVLEGDFDEDGSQELAIKILVYHGTGVAVEQLFMADKSSDGKWYAYEISSEWYNEQLQSHIESNYTEEGLELLIDGESKGVFEDVNNDPTAAYCVGSQIDFSFEDEEIRLIAKLVIYSDSNFAGTGYYDELIMTLDYLGDGKWQEETCEFVYNEEERQRYAEWKEEQTASVAEGFDEIFKHLTGSQMYAEITYMDGDTEIPLLLVADKENVDTSNNTASNCRVYALLEDGVHDFDYIYSDGKSHPIKADETGLYIARLNWIDVYAPSSDEKALVLAAYAEAIDNGNRGYTHKALIDGALTQVEDDAELKRLQAAYREAEVVKFQAVK